jgi:predicted nucleic acid-binding protein
MGLIYLDASVAIYAVEDTSVDSGSIRDILLHPAAQEYAISPLVKMECLVGPVRQANIASQRYYEAWLSQFRYLPLDDSVFETATDLRARFNLKTPDALHLGAALTHGCSGIWTRDHQLAAAGRQLAIDVIE